MAQNEFGSYPTAIAFIGAKVTRTIPEVEHCWAAIRKPEIGGKVNSGGIYMGK